MRKVFKLILSIFFVTYFIACSSDNESSNPLKHHVVITYLTTGDKPTNSGTSEMLAKLNERLTKLCNAELEICYIPWYNYDTRYNVKLAEKDGSIDLIGTATDWLNAWDNANLGNFMPLSDKMIETYAPKTWNSVSKEHWDSCRQNGNIYFFPEDNFTQWTNHGFMYRLDWAREAGLNGVHSWEDLTKYFKFVKEVKNLLPWDSNCAANTFHADGYFQSKTDYIIIDGITSTSMIGSHKNNTKKVYSPFYEGKELVEYAKLMKKWNDMGVWPKNVVTERGGSRDNRTEFCDGVVGVEQHHSQTWYTIVAKQLEKNVPGADCGFFWFGEESQTLVYQTITHGAMAIASTSKHPERALMVYDLLRNDEECYNLINYGVEGVQFRRNKDGYRESIPNAKGITTNYWWGRNDKLEIRDTNTAWDKFDAMCTEYNKCKIDYPYGKIVWDLTPISSEISNIVDVYGDYMVSICYGQVENPEEYVAEFRSKLKAAGIEKVIAEIQRQLDAFNKQN